MHRLKLVSSPFVDPRWFRLPEQTTIAMDSTTVQVYGETFVLFDPNEISLETGEAVYVWIERNFMMETKQEREARLQQRKELRAKQEQEEKERAGRERREAEAFNATLHIPVRWVPGIKDVLSGLSDDSWGDGRNKATVNHIVLLEELNDGRIHRKQHDLLCTSPSGSNGKRWHGMDYDRGCLAYDGNNDAYPAKITCKSCLKIAQRWS